jgi:hypothetical protein
MADLTLRQVKGTPLSNAEVDNNFLNLNRDILLSPRNSQPWVASAAAFRGQILNHLNNFYVVTTAGTLSSVTPPTHATGSTANGTTVLRYEVPAPYTPLDVIAKVAEFGGADSGIDADLLDGMDSSSGLPVTADKSSVVVRDAAGDVEVKNMIAVAIFADLTGDVTGTASNALLLDSRESAAGVVANTVVIRDANGDFAGNVIVANEFQGDVTGTASNSALLNSLTLTQILQSAEDNAIALSIALG